MNPVKRSACVTLVVAAIVLTQSGCALLMSLLTGNFQRPTITVRSVDVTGLTLGSISVNLNCDVQNPNNFQIDLGSFDYDLALDGRPLVGGKLAQGFTLPPSGTGSVAFPITFPFAQLGQTVLDLLRKDAVAYGIKATLGFNSPVGIIAVPVEQSGTLPVPKLPDVRLADASFGDVGFSGGTLRVKIGLGNRNNFAVPLGALNYHMLIEGIEVGGGGVPAPTLAAHGNSDLEIPVRVDFLGAGRAVVQAVQSGRINLHVQGGLDLAELHQALPVDEQTTINLR